MKDLRGFERISAQALDFADNSLLAGWSFEDYMDCAKEAWVTVHENNLVRARLEVKEHDKKIRGE